MINDLWEKANEISEISYKIHSAAMVVELVAADISDDAQSGSLWLARDVLAELSDKLDEKVSDIMTWNRKNIEAQQEAKEENLIKKAKTK